MLFDYFWKIDLELRNILTMKWKIKRTEENYNVINDYFNKLSTTGAKYSSTDGWCYSEPINTQYHIYSDSDGTVLDDGTFIQITFEEFERMILGKKQCYEIY